MEQKPAYSKEAAKQLEEIIRENVEKWDFSAMCIAFEQLAALGITRQIAHGQKRRLGLSQ